VSEKKWAPEEMRAIDMTTPTPRPAI